MDSARRELIQSKSNWTYIEGYRNRGRAGCSAPQLRTTELDQIMAHIFTQLVQDKRAIIDTLIKVIQSVPDEHGYAQDARRIQDEIFAVQAKKDRLLEMSIDGIITATEFKQRSDGFNEQVEMLEGRLAALQAEAEKGRRTTEQLGEIRAALERELTPKTASIPPW